MSGIGSISGLGSAGSGLGLVERPRGKVEFACSCGKRYRVPADRAGRKLRCRACKLKITVPRSESLSSNEAELILAELGINAHTAREAYRSQSERVTCFFCAGALTRSEVEGLSGGQRPVCLTCQASTADAQVSQRGAASDEGERKHKELDQWVGDHAQQAKRRALAVAAFVMVGGACFASSVLGWGLLGAVPLSAAAAGLAAQQILRHS